MRYFVYTHTILEEKKPFFVGKGTIQNGETHKSLYGRAYSKMGRNKFWHKKVVGKKYKVEIVYESLSEIDTLNKEAELKKLYGMKRIIKYGWGTNKYKKGKGSLVNVQEHEHRINKCTNKVCPFCEGRSVWNGKNKHSFYCKGLFCEGNDGWTEGVFPNQKTIHESEIDYDFLEQTGEFRKKL